jgi:Kdo2-lipid IVA lauroyltransferase/acyltransferase
MLSIVSKFSDLEYTIIVNILKTQGGVIMKITLSSFLQWQVNILICRLMGWKFTFFYICILGKLYFFFNRKEKWKIKKAIQSVFSDHKYRSETKAITQNVFQGILSHYFEKFVNAYTTPGTLRNFIKSHMKSEGLNAIRQGLSTGKGVLLITGHYGGVEFIPAFLGDKNFPVSIIVKFGSNDLRNASIQQASNFRTQIIDANRSPNIMKTIFSHLKANRIVIIQCDEIDEWKPCRYEKIFFLGKQVYLDKTMNILSKRCGAPIVFGVMQRTSPNRYKFVATSWEEMAKKYQRSTDMTVGAVLLKLMEHYIYKYPQGWYQWKKYFALDRFATFSIETEVPLQIPLLEPSMGKFA